MESVTVQINVRLSSMRDLGIIVTDGYTSENISGRRTHPGYLCRNIHLMVKCHQRIRKVRVKCVTETETCQQQTDTKLIESMTKKWRATETLGHQKESALSGH